MFEKKSPGREFLQFWQYSADVTGDYKLFVILGPTASGKSDLAMALAGQIGGEILSVDSMQVYRCMNIGTAKPTPQEQQKIKHHLIDLVDPSEEFAVARFVELADATIADAKRRKVPLIVTGGTPLYYKSLFEGLFDGPGADTALRERLNLQPLEELHKKLAQVDPEASRRIHVNDRKRIVRALEVYELTGKPISAQQTEWASGEMRHDAAWIGLNWEKEALSRRINLRVRKMIDAGWLEETRDLIVRFPTLSKTAAGATGYRELIEHIKGNLPLDEAIEQIKIATRQLARRQMKWFRRFENVKWLDGGMATETILRSIAK